MFNVGTLAFYLSLDDSQFRQGMGNVQTLVTKTAQVAKSAGQALASTVTAAAASATTLGVKLFKTGAAYNSMQQNSRAALKTILGSTEAVNAQMEKLNALARKSPFSKALFIQGQQQLLAFGMSAEKVIPTLDAVQNAVAAAGGSAQQLSDLVFVMAQIQAAGKITGQDLIQMGQRGINAAQLIGEAMGMSTAEVKAAISKNKINAEDALDAMISGMARKFGGATDLIKQQWVGATDRIKAAWRDTGAVISQPFIDPNGGGMAVKWANLVADIMRGLQKHVTTVMDEIKIKGVPVFDAITKSLETVSSKVQSFNLQRFIRQVKDLGAYTPLVSGLAASLVTLGLRPLPILGRLGAGLGPVIAGIGALVATSPKLREAAEAFTGALHPAYVQLESLAKAAANLGLQLINALAPHLKVVAAGAAGFISHMGAVASLCVQAATSLVPLVELGGRFAAWISGLPTPLLTVAAALVAFHKPLGAVRDGLMHSGQAVASFVSTTRKMALEQNVAAPIIGVRAAVMGLKGALTALLSPTNLVGLAITAVTAVIAVFASKQAEAKAHTDELANSLDSETGAITKQTHAIVLKKLTEDGVIENAKKLAIATDLVTAAATGNARAQEMFQGRVKAVREELEQEHEALVKRRNSGELYTKTLNVELATNNAKRDALKALEEAVSSETEAVKKEQEAKRESNDTTQKSVNLTRDEASAKEALEQAEKKLYAIQRDRAAAQGDLTMANYRVSDAIQALNEQLERGERAAKAYSGGVDWFAESTRKFVEAGVGAAQAMDTQLQNMVKAGKGQDELNAKVEENKATLRAQAESFGLVGKEVDEYIKKIGFIPEYKTLILDVNEKEALLKTGRLLDHIQSKNGTITLLTDDSQAVKSLARYLKLVETSEGTFSIDADTDPALAMLFTMIGDVNESEGTVTLRADQLPAMETLKETLKDMNASEGVMKVLADNTKALTALDWTKTVVERTKAGIAIEGRDNATAVADTIVRNINGRSAYIKIFGQRVSTGLGGGQGGITFAQGGIVEYYKNGGIRKYAGGGVEKHVAQIAPAGAWRIWAEPETGGEGYIPLALSKRDRSKKIMAEIARRFGDVYIPAGANRYAAGGLTDTTSRGAERAAGTIVNFTQNIQQAFTKPDSDTASEGAAIARLVGVL
ncbi:tape measure protein [Schaalia sp. lx-100]|uniref:tape measure protein n=1 Tax=Schaalia sp. lx-100 TaxID=2899081 RepID=UPI001E597CF0|nr:tape measure protein [Schaalia sp. lx-100]MCD4558222.1 tape measure protein [Schaalia sp. lx-100]